MKVETYQEQVAQQEAMVAATHVITWHGSKPERVSVIEDKTYPNTYGGDFDRMGTMLVQSEETGEQRWISFGLYNAIKIEPVADNPRPRVQTWAVIWRVYGTTDLKDSRCVLTEGYTTLNDITKMIGIKRGIDPNTIELVALAKVMES